MDGAEEANYERFEHGQWQHVDGAVVREALVRLHLNGRELVTLMCTPLELDLLAVGFLCSEGIIQGMGEVRLINVCPSQTCVEVWLFKADVALPERRTITSGCGGGITFADMETMTQAVQSDLRVTPALLSQLMQKLQESSQLYRRVRGVHSAALANIRGELLAVGEDVGRHNAVDKLWGRCLIEHIPTEDCILLSTGRISSEMLYKAARMGTPVVASRTSPTSLSIRLARTWQVTVAGYVRRDSLNVYSCQERIVHNEEEHGHANS